MIKKLALISMPLIITSCVSTMPNTISFEIDSKAYGSKNTIVFKNNGPNCSINDLASMSPDPFKIFSSEHLVTCTIDPEGTVPQEITIEYAIWYTQQQLISQDIHYPNIKYRDYSLAKNELDYERLRQEEKNENHLSEMAYNKELKAIENLPPSAWHKITLHPIKLVEKYKNETPQYPLKAKKEYSKGRKLHYQIKINSDGTYLVEDRLEWLHPSFTEPTKSNTFYGFALIIANLFGGAAWN